MDQKLQEVLLIIVNYPIGQLEIWTKTDTWYTTLDLMYTKELVMVMDAKSSQSPMNIIKNVCFLLPKRLNRINYVSLARFN